MKRKTIRNSNEIVASINYIARMLPGLREPEIVGYAFDVMAKDIKAKIIDDFVWNDLSKIDFKDSKMEFSDTRGVSIKDDAWKVIMDSYMAREEVQRAPLAYVTKLVLAYVRQKLQLEIKLEDSEQILESEMITNEEHQSKRTLEIKCVEKLGDLNAEEVGRLVRLNRYLNLLIHTDPVSIEKIKKIDEILKEN